MKRIVLCAAVLSLSFNCVTASASITRTDLNEPEDNTIYPVVPGTGECGETMLWDMNENGELYISGSGDMYDDYLDEYTNMHTKILTPEEATSLKEWYEYIPWFKNNNTKAVVKITIDDGISSIGKMAFDGTNIEYAYIPSSVNRLGELAFANCKKLKKIILPDNLENISDWGFAYCKALSYIHLPSNLKKIGMGAFEGCYNLSEIKIPEGVTDIDEIAFFNCMNLNSIELPENVEIVHKRSFACCDNLGTVILSPRLKVIEEGAFSDCFSLSEIIIPDGVTTIGSNAFSFTEHSNNNQIIYIPKSVTEIGLNAFNKDNTVIYGFNDSYAKVWAEDNNIQFKEVTESMYHYKRLENKVIEVVSTSDRINLIASYNNVIFPDAQPYIDENGRTKIPIRAVAEALGAKVDWNGAERVATITKDNKVITIAIGNNNMQVGNDTVIMDTTAEIKDDRTYIPVRFVGEALGMTVNWQG